MCGLHCGGMGVVVSAIATGLVHNIQADFQTVQTAGYPAVVAVVAAPDSPAPISTAIPTTGFPAVSLTPHLNIPVNRAAPPDTDSPSIETKHCVITVKENINVTDIDNTATWVKQEQEATIGNNSENGKEDEEEQNTNNILVDFFSSLGLKTPVPDKVLSLDNVAETAPTSPRLPVVSLLPTLTEDLSLGLVGRRSDPGWFRAGYTSTDTVQRVYGTHPLYPRPRR